MERIEGTANPMQRIAQQYSWRAKLIRDRHQVLITGGHGNRDQSQEQRRETEGERESGITTEAGRQGNRKTEE